MSNVWEDIYYIRKKDEIKRVQYSNASTRYKSGSNKMLNKLAVFRLQENSACLNFLYEYKANCILPLYVDKYFYMSAIYIDKGACNVMDKVLAKSMRGAANQVSELIYFGEGTCNIVLKKRPESDNKYSEAYLLGSEGCYMPAFMINSLVPEVNIIAHGNCVFMGTITEDNRSMEIFEDTIVLADNTVLTLASLKNFVRDYDSYILALHSLKQAKTELANIWERMRVKITQDNRPREFTLDFKEGYFFSAFEQILFLWNEAIEDMLPEINIRDDAKKLDSPVIQSESYDESKSYLSSNVSKGLDGSIVVDSTILAKDSIVQEQVDNFEKININHVNKNSMINKAKDNQALTENSKLPAIKNRVSITYDDVISKFRAYQTDLVKMMERPALSNFSDKVVKDFHLLCLKIEHGEVSMDPIELESEWLILLSHADTQQASHFSKEQSQKFSDSKDLLSKAFNEESTDNEKDLSIKALERKLIGVLPVNEALLNNLKQQVGLKEIH